MGGRPFLIPICFEVHVIVHQAMQTCIAWTLVQVRPLFRLVSIVHMVIFLELVCWLNCSPIHSAMRRLRLLHEGSYVEERRGLVTSLCCGPDSWQPVAAKAKYEMASALTDDGG